MITLNSEQSPPLMGRIHKPDPKLPAYQQDKRSVVAIEQGDVERWPRGSAKDVAVSQRNRFAGVPAG